MKLPTSQLMDFNKKQLHVLYTETTANTYRLIKNNYTQLRQTFTPTLNLVKGGSTWVDALVNHSLYLNSSQAKTKFRKGFNEDGVEILVALVEDLKQQNKVTTLGRNLTILDTNFLRKEKIYAKLKYSRSPQYDIVSGGIAAIFSGFLGFLICEKFGLELLDSGDFYTAFMYGVFIVFACRPLIRVVNGLNKDRTYTPTYNILSLQPLLQFYSNLVKLLFKSLKLPK